MESIKKFSYQSSLFFHFVTKKQTVYMISLFVIMLIFSLLAITFGSYGLSIIDYFLCKTSQIQNTVLIEIRLPRVILSCLAGASLGISGAALQGLFRNPLADPGLIGVSAGAALGATLMIVLGGDLFSQSSLGIFFYTPSCCCRIVLGNFYALFHDERLWL